MKPPKGHKNLWHVWRDGDVGTHIWMPWLKKKFALRMAKLMNEIEEDRVTSLKGDRANGDGDFYSAQPSVKPTK